jgi:DamX protein
MQYISLVLVALTLAGCSSRPAPPESTPVTQIPAVGGWYCQPGLSPGTWDCVQDPALAENPPPPRPLPVAPPPEPEPAPIVEGPPLAEFAPASVDAGEAEASADPAVHRLAGHSPDRYTIQLVAMDTRRALEPLLARDDLGDAVVARVEREGASHYVLVIGEYETVRQARQAIDDLAEDLKALEPWVRPVRGLQAVRR